MTDRMTDLRKSLAATSQALAESETIIAQLRDELAAARQAPAPVVVTDDAEARRLSGELAKAQDEIERLKANMSATADLANALAQTEEAARLDLAKAEKALEQQDKTIDQLRAALAAAQAGQSDEIEQLRGQLNEAWRNMRSAEKTTEAIRAQLRETTQKR